jgi:hypothetical protein
MLLLNYLIKIIHFVIILVVILSPVVNDYDIKKLVLGFLLYLLFQYITGYNKCGLTELEYYVIGEKYKEGFIYRIVNPMIQVSEDYFNNCRYIIHIGLILILIYQIIVLDHNNIYRQ